MVGRKIFLFIMLKNFPWGRWENKRANTGSEFAVASTIAKCKKLELNEIDYSQRFSQKVVSTRLWHNDITKM